ncbi:MAG: AMP-binding protein [Pseudomonadota bacterium]
MSEQAVYLHDLVYRQAELRPGAPALWWQGRYTSYRDLSALIEGLACGIAARTKPGARVAVLSWNSNIYQALLYAVPAAGRIIVPLNARLAAPELMHQLHHAGVDLLLAQSALAGPLLARQDLPHGLEILCDEDGWPSLLIQGELPGERIAMTADTPAWLLYTSGSTGRPKGAVLTHSSLLAGLDSGAQGRPVMPDDRFLYPFPLFHVAAHNTLLQHRYGACVMLLPGFDALEVIRCCLELGITTLSAAPTMLGMLLDHPDFDKRVLADLRAIGYGASSMPLSLLERLMAVTEADLSQGYGMTELSGSIAFLGADDHRRARIERPDILQSVGKPVRGVAVRLAGEAGGEVAVGESGEILVKARQCLQAYWQQPEATRAAFSEGWFATGDIGRFDDDGYLFIVDRKKDMIVSGGENIASKEVEEVLRLHPAVRDAAVIGVDDPQWGESLCALIVRHDREEGGPKGADLIAHCRAYLAGYKIPRRYETLDALPLNANGKVDKPLLRRRYNGQAV